MKHPDFRAQHGQHHRRKKLGDGEEVQHLEMRQTIHGPRQLEPQLIFYPVDGGLPVQVSAFQVQLLQSQHCQVVYGMEQALFLQRFLRMMLDH